MLCLLVCLAHGLATYQQMRKKMSGKDHDMFHIWVEKYLSTLKELKAPEAETQKAAFNKIGGQLKSVDQYFE